MDDPIIDLHSDDYFMGEALRQAARAYEQGEVPVGAVVVRAGRIIARAGNQVEILKDATAHAEMLALTQAENAVGDWRLTDCTLYVTKEPCPMCAGAVVHTRRGPGGVWRERPQGRRGGRGAESAPVSLSESSLRNHVRPAAGGVPRPAQSFFRRAARGQKEWPERGVRIGKRIACHSPHFMA